MLSQFFHKFALVLACAGGSCHARRVEEALLSAASTQNLKQRFQAGFATDSIAQVRKSYGQERFEAASDIDSDKIRSWLKKLFYLSLFNAESFAFNARTGQLGGAPRASNAKKFRSLALRGMRHGGPLLKARNNEEIEEILSKVNTGSVKEKYMMQDRGQLITSYVDSHELLEADNAMGFLPTNIQRDPNADQFVLVDEDTCIGCTYCSTLAPNTFRMEDDIGAARVFQQVGDTPEDIQTAVECCPVDCIHYVSFNELRILEKAKRAALSTTAGQQERMKIVARRRAFGIDSLEASGPGWRYPLEQMDPRSLAKAAAKVAEGEGLEQPVSDTADSDDDIETEETEEEDDTWKFDALYPQRLEENIEETQEEDDSWKFDAFYPERLEENIAGTLEGEETQEDNLDPDVMSKIFEVGGGEGFQPMPTDDASGGDEGENEDGHSNGWG